MPKKGDTQHKQEVDRVRCLQMIKDGKTVRQIMKELKRSNYFVCETKKNRKIVYKCKTKTRTGRPRKLNAALKKIIRKSRNKRKGSTRKLAKKIKEDTGISISKDIVWRFQREEGQKPYKRQTQPLLTIKNIEARKKFAQKYGSKSLAFWDNWLFTDEKYFGLSERSNSKNDVIWSDNPNNIKHVKQPKNEAKIMIWGGFSCKGLTPLVIFKPNETLNKSKYLRKVLVPMIRDIKSRDEETDNLTTTKLFDDINNWTFQQDGCSSHTANNVQQWLSQNVPKWIPKKEWPGNSPDLNPIENLWSIMETKLYDDGHFGTIEELIEKIKQVWESTQVSTLQALAQSMKSRLEHVKQAPDKKAPY